MVHEFDRCVVGLDAEPKESKKCFQKPKIATHFFNQIRLRAMKYKHTSACFIAVDSRPERASKQAKVIDALIEFYR